MNPSPPPKPATKPPRAEPAPRRVICDVCGHEALDLHCKVRCMNCGAMRDCSDP